MIWIGGGLLVAACLLWMLALEIPEPETPFDHLTWPPDWQFGEDD